jgi:hypothetical protein
MQPLASDTDGARSTREASAAPAATLIMWVSLFGERSLVRRK